MKTLFFYLVMALIVRVIVWGLDKSRVEEDVTANGGQLVSMKWKPFGRNWYARFTDRIYKVLYEDENGDLHDSWGTYKYV